MDIITLLSNSTAWLILCIGLVSLLIGSFLNVVIYRLPIMMEREWTRDCNEFLGRENVMPDNHQDTFNLVVPRSRCPHCGHAITAWENIPVLSYLFLRGRCIECKTPISFQYPLVEIITALLSVLVALQYGFSVTTLALLFFTWTLVALAVIDIKTMLLPDNLVYPLLWAGILFSLFADIPLSSLKDSVLGAVFGYLSLWGIFHLFRLITGKEGMGHGDFKLLAALGAWGGWQILPFIIFSASALGALFGVAWMLIKRQGSTPLPFGPWLALAGYIAVVWHKEILQLNQHFFIP